MDDGDSRPRCAALMTDEVKGAGVDSSRWFAVRCIFHHAALETYDERITLWQASDLDNAVAQAEREAYEYSGTLENVRYLGLAQAFHLYDQPGQGAEAFSLMRDSQLEPDAYVTQFFATGSERQQQET